jgi:hypothetical protein
MKNIKNPEKVVEDLNKIRDNAFIILEKMKDTAETRNLKARLQNCDDVVEYLEIATEVSLRAFQEIQERAK